MSREDGFAVMDVSTSWHEDPKFRRIWRRRPDLLTTAGFVYLALVAESWRQGKRVSIDDAWPPLVPYDADVVAELVGAQLIDRGHRVASKTWTGWFKPAAERQSRARERYARYNAKRHAAAMGLNSDDDASPTSLPRGNQSGTTATVPSVRPSDPSVRSEKVNEASVGTEGSAPRRLVHPVEVPA